MLFWNFKMVSNEFSVCGSTTTVLEVDPSNVVFAISQETAFRSRKVFQCSKLNLNSINIFKPF